MKKKVASITVAGLIMLSPFLSEIANAETLESIHKKQNEVEKKKEATQKQKNEIDEQLSDLKNDIEKLDKSIMETKERMQEKEEEIERQKREIDRLNGEIQELNEQINRRMEILKNRIAAQQKSGVSNPYLQVLLGSQDVSDFIGRISAISELMSADNEIVEQLEDDLHLVEKKEKEEFEKHTIYEKQLEELKELEDALNEKFAEKEELFKDLELQAEEALEELQVLEEEEEFLKEQEAAIIKAAEEAVRKAREEEERRAALNIPVITEDLFMRPANGPVTSEFGRRTLNGSEGNHFGIDIGKRGDKVPIVAAAEGVVIRADYSTSYGNVVFITHNLDGRVYTTVYSHLESLSVESGEIVEKGQELGLMGNTGFSFGAHLHFEIHEGEWNLQKSNAVDPRMYIDF